MKQLPFHPLVVRVGHAPGYLGMDRRTFDAEIKPFLTKPIPVTLGGQGKGWERVELDRAWVEYRSRLGRPSDQEESWDEEERRVSTERAKSGTSTKKSSESEFAKARTQATSLKQNAA